jgi:hypothetical protein
MRECIQLAGLAIAAGTALVVKVTVWFRYGSQLRHLLKALGRGTVLIRVQSCIENLLRIVFQVHGGLSKKRFEQDAEGNMASSVSMVLIEQANPKSSSRATRH